MTELVISVRLKADGSGLVGQANAAAAAIEEMGKATVDAGHDAKGMATAAAAAEASAHGLAVGAAAADREVTELAAAARKMAEEQRQATAAMGGLEGRSTTTATAIDGMGRSVVGTSRDVVGMAAATAAAEAGARSLATGAAVADRSVGELATAAREMAGEQRQAAAAIGVLEGRIGQSNTTFRVGAADANRHAYAIKNVGQQVGDFGLQVASGQDVARAFSQQIGQLGYAMSDLGGRAGKVGTFLTGPWGIALTIAAAVAAPFVSKLFETKDAAAQAETATSQLASVEGDLAAIFGKTSSKIAEQNELLRVNARIKASNLRVEAAQQAKDASKAFATAGTDYIAPATPAGTAGLFGAINFATGNRTTTNPAVAKLAERARAANGLTDSEQRQQAFDALLKESRTTDFAGSPIDRKTFQEAIVKAVASRANQRIADLTDTSLDAGRIDPLLAKPTGRKHRPKSTEARDEFGRDAADRLATLTERFDHTPLALQKTNREIRQLDDLIDDLNRKKPPGFENLIATAEAAKVSVRRGLIDGVAEAFAKPRTLGQQAAAAMRQLDAVAADLEQRKPPQFESLIADVERARGAIQDGLTRPLAEFVAAQQASLQVGELIAAGRTAEAAALQAIVQLERQMGPLTDGQKDAVLATTRALAAQERQVERLHRRQQAYLNALGDVQSIVAQTIFDGPQGLASLPDRLAEAFKRFAAEKLTESLFGDAFEKLRDQVTGTKIVEDAAHGMAAAVETVTGRTGQAAKIMTIH